METYYLGPTEDPVALRLAAQENMIQDIRWRIFAASSTVSICRCGGRVAPARGDCPADTGDVFAPEAPRARQPGRENGPLCGARRYGDAGNSGRGSLSVEYCRGP